MATVSLAGSAVWRELARRSGCAAAVLPLMLFLASTLSSQTTEYQVKAAYLANFPKFIEWPVKVAAGEPFNICVLGQDPFGVALDAAVAGETIDRAPIVAKRISQARDALDCRVLFVSSSEEGQWGQILATLKTSSVLTVSDMSEFARRGGIVQFVLDGSKVRFEVNLAAAGVPRLRLRSELLKLAVTVRRNP